MSRRKLAEQYREVHGDAKVHLLDQEDVDFLLGTLSSIHVRPLFIYSFSLSKNDPSSVYRDGEQNVLGAGGDYPGPGQGLCKRVRASRGPPAAHHRIGAAESASNGHGKNEADPRGATEKEGIVSILLFVNFCKYFQCQ